jgi:peptidoglycan/LPS O-acetylase OafA/YrhL
VESISLWSYSLYLSHDLIITLLARYAARSGDAGHPLPEWARIGLMLLLPFGVSAALYRWFETPFLKLRDKLTLKPEARPGQTG